MVVDADLVLRPVEANAGGPTATVVKTGSVAGVATEGNPPLKAIATCPSGSRLVGGGVLDTPDNTTNFKPLASYPSDSSGNAATNTSLNPDSWTAYSTWGFTINANETTTAFAVCATAALPTVQIARADIAGPSNGFSNVSVACPQDTTLLDGGLPRRREQQHAAAGAARPGQLPELRRLTQRHRGGRRHTQPRFLHGHDPARRHGPRSTNSHVFALCAAPNVSADVLEVPWPAALPGSAALTLLAATVTRRRRLPKSS